MHVTILGAGNAGCALAAELSLLGHQVCLYAALTHTKNLDEITQVGGITLEGEMQGFCKIDFTTTDLRQALEFADIVFLAIPSFAQVEIIDQVFKLMHHGQTFISLSGNFSALFFQNRLQSLGIKKNVNFGDLNSSVHACRVNPGAKVYIFARKQKLVLSLIKPDPQTYNLIEALLDRSIIRGKNILEPGFRNTNTIVHPAPILLNIAWVESRQGDFYFYKEGISPTIADLLEQMDEEKLAISSMFGLKVPRFVDTMKNFYNRQYDNILNFARKSPTHNAIKGTPKTLNTRYTLEDIPFGLVPWFSLASLAGIKVPVTETLIRLACLVYGVDFFTTGRTLEDMGLGELSLTQANQLLNPKV